MSLTRDAILTSDDLAIVKVDVPEWGDHAYVRTLTGKERDEFEGLWTQARATGGPYPNIRAQLAARTLCDEAGTPLFTVADVEQLGGRSSVALDRVFMAARNVNKLSEDDVKELEGNSESAPIASSGSS